MNLITLTAIKEIFSKTATALWPFIQQNWKILLILGLTVALFLSMKKDYAALEDAFDASKTSYEEQIRSLKEIHSEEIRQREEAMREYREELERITERYEDSRSKLERGRERDVEEVRRQLQYEPEEVKQSIIEQFGFEYVE